MNITKYSLILAIASLAACQSDDSKFEDLLAESQKKETPMDISFPNNILVETPDKVPAANDESYNDYVESFTPKVEIGIVYDGNDARVTNTSSKVAISQNGAHIVADISTTAVKFTISGKSSNGSLRIEGDNRFEIDMNGVELSNPAGAVINNQSKKTLYIVACDGTENLLSAGANTEEGDAKGCLFSEGQIAFSGSGYLQVNSAFRNGIASDDYIFIRPCTRLNVYTSSGNGIKANDGVKINGGNIDVLVEYNGGKGINSEDYVAINGGRTTIINLATTRLDRVPVSDEFKEGIDTVSCAGIKCDADLTVTDGELRIKCTGNDSKGIKTNANYLQNGGNVAIVTLGKKELASPKAIKADGNISVTNGILYAYSSYSVALDADGKIYAYAYKQDNTYLVEIGN